MIICLPDDKMASAEAGRFATLSEEDFEFNILFTGYEDNQIAIVQIASK
jgi:hypothetical protein